MSFERTTPDSEGVYILEPGQYFIDGNEDEISEVLPALLEVVGKKSLKRILIQRDFEMVSFKIDTKVEIPRDIYLRTGFFYKIPAGYDLKKVSKELYGDSFEGEYSFWNWTAENMPEFHGQLLEIAEETKKAGENVASYGKTTALLGAALIGALIFIKVKK